VRVERRHRSPGGRTEADDRRAKPTTVDAGRPDQLERVQHRAVAREFVVLVKDVQQEATVTGPVVHRLERDQGQPPVDGQLGDLGILDAMRPAPHDLTFPHLRKITGLKLRQHDDVAVAEQPVPGEQPTHVRRQLLVGHAERLAVPVLQVDVVPKVGVDSLEMHRMDRKPSFVLLARMRHDAEGEERSSVSVSWHGTRSR
jgi:hypothetical protein